MLGIALCLDLFFHHVSVYAWYRSLSRPLLSPRVCICLVSLSVSTSYFTRCLYMLGIALCLDPLFHQVRVYAGYRSLSRPPLSPRVCICFVSLSVSTSSFTTCLYMIGIALCLDLFFHHVSVYAYYRSMSRPPLHQVPVYAWYRSLSRPPLSPGVCICFVSISVSTSSFTTCLYMLGIALCLDLFFHHVPVYAWYRSLTRPLLSPRACICLVSLSVSTSSFTTCLYILGIALCLDLFFHHVSVYAGYRSLSRPLLSPGARICLVSLSFLTPSFTTCLYLLGIALCLDLFFHHVPVYAGYRSLSRPLLSPRACICFVSVSFSTSSFTTCLYMLGIALCLNLLFHHVSVYVWYRSLSRPLLSPGACICLVSLFVSTSSFTTCLYMLGIALCLDLLFHQVPVYAGYRSLSRPPLSPRVCICWVSLYVSTSSFSTCLYMLGIGLCLELFFHHVSVYAWCQSLSRPLLSPGACICWVSLSVSTSSFTRCLYMLGIALCIDLVFHQVSVYAWYRSLSRPLLSPRACICLVSFSVSTSSFSTCLYMLGIGLCLELFFHHVSVYAWCQSLSRPLLSPRVCICWVLLSASTSSFTRCLYMLGIALCLDLLFHHVSVYAWYRSLSRHPLSPRVCICLVSLSVSTSSFTTCLYLLGIALCLDLFFHHVPVYAGYRSLSRPLLSPRACICFVSVSFSTSSFTTCLYMLGIALCLDLLFHQVPVYAWYRSLSRPPLSSRVCICLVSLSVSTSPFTTCLYMLGIALCLDLLFQQVPVYAWYHSLSRPPLSPGVCICLVSISVSTFTRCLSVVTSAEDVYVLFFVDNCNLSKNVCSCVSSSSSAMIAHCLFLFHRPI
ncbi:hypothetical protein DPMN_067458 [Dreissena polymorpha]|uniref:Uncharacterized protein n=1 Tax=Dreissena polymorpha TaxID=45954 RepID=A0A9D4BTH5_DREPO|nr:hypothetical protein DPMN_067458 [Dreissena polymorpha]